MKDKKNMIILLLVLVIMVVVIIDLVLIFNKEKKDYKLYNCQIKKEIILNKYNVMVDGVLKDEIKVHFYDLVGILNIKYDEKRKSYVANFKENYKFVYPFEYESLVAKETLFNNHSYERDDENATIKLDYEESIETNKINEYLKQKEEYGFICQEIYNK